MKTDIIAAHRHSSHHRQELEASEWCGCFYCLAIFSPREITMWLNEGPGTAMCPECVIDSVIGSASGYPITREFLGEMHQHWFQDPPKAMDPITQAFLDEFHRHFSNEPPEAIEKDPLSL